MIGFIGTSIKITVSYNSLQSIIVYDSIHSLLDYECLLFRVPDLVPIYESVTSSASVVSWVGLHSWKLNFYVKDIYILHVNKCI
jgi:hypothetical protein